MVPEFLRPGLQWPCRKALLGHWTPWLLKWPIYELTWQIWSKGKDLNWSFVSWTKTEDVKKSLGRSEMTCVALGGLFPGLRWRGAYLAVSAYLTASRSLEHSAATIRNRIIGHDIKYLAGIHWLLVYLPTSYLVLSLTRTSLKFFTHIWLMKYNGPSINNFYFWLRRYGSVCHWCAVHWRFEESLCGGQEMGSCFLRCGDGAIINTGLHPLAKELIDSSSKACHFHSVKVTEEDIVGAIHDRACDRNLSTIYLATDGWIRGQEGVRLIKEVWDEINFIILRSKIPRKMLTIA